jgi:predicted GNAT family acetyltransferase
MRRGAPLTMDATHSRLLDEVRGLAAARALIEHALEEAVKESHNAGVDGWRIAAAADIHRSTLYRRYLASTRSRIP